jgi:hypothetical protein
MRYQITLAAVLALNGCRPASYEIVRPDKKGSVVDGKHSPTPPGNPNDDPDNDPATPPGDLPPGGGPGDSPRNEPVPNPGNPGTPGTPDKPGKPGKPDPCDPQKPKDPDCPNTPGQNPGQNPGQTPGQHPTIPPVQRSESPAGGQCNFIKLCSQTQLPKCNAANDGITAYISGFQLMFLCTQGQWKEVALPEGWPED